MDNFLWLDQIQKSDRSQVGEKAFYLSHLAQRGYPVIPGFAIEAQALHEFLETIHWLDPLFADLPNSSLHLDVDNPRQLQLVARAIRQEIAAAALPAKWLGTLASISEDLEAPALILRPSLGLPGVAGNLKISGLLDAHVCDRSQDALAAAVKRVWAELFRARSLLFWRRNGIQLQQINLAILVQPLHNSVAAGVLQANSNLWEIQATCGLGIALVKGEVLPDYYQVQPESGAVVMRQLGTKTLAYNLVEQHSGQRVENKSGLIPLQTYLLSEEQQKQYALEEKYLQELIQLAQRLKAEIGSAFTLEWTLTAKASESTADRLYLTQIRTNEEMENNAALEQVSREAQENQALQLKTQNPKLKIFASSVSHLFRGIGAAGGRAIAKAQVIIEPSENTETIPTGRILVLKSFHPDWLPLLKQAVGVIAEQGGMTCHAGIVARELGIPAVVGVKNATQSIQSDQLVLVDGDRGEIYLLPEQEIALTGKVEKQSEWSRGDTTPSMGHQEEEQSSNSHNQHSIPALWWNSTGLPNAQLPLANTQHPMANAQLPTPNTQSPIVATQLLVNLSQPSTIKRAASLPVDGVGLLRSELMMLEILQGQHPSRWVTLGQRQELI